MRAATAEGKLEAGEGAAPDLVEALPVPRVGDDGERFRVRFDRVEAERFTAAAWSDVAEPRRRREHERTTPFTAERLELATFGDCGLVNVASQNQLDAGICERPQNLVSMA